MPPVSGLPGLSMKPDVSATRGGVKISLNRTNPVTTISITEATTLKMRHASFFF